MLLRKGAAAHPIRAAHRNPRSPLASAVRSRCCVGRDSRAPARPGVRTPARRAPRDRPRSGSAADGPCRVGGHRPVRLDGARPRRPTPTRRRAAYPVRHGSGPTLGAVGAVGKDGSAHPPPHQPSRPGTSPSGPISPSDGGRGRTTGLSSLWMRSGHFISIPGAPPCPVRPTALLDGSLVFGVFLPFGGLRGSS